MKFFVFDPLWDTLIDSELSSKVSDAGLEVEVISDIAPITEYKPLFEGTEPRVLCLNPDYVGWNLKSADYENIPGLTAILGAATSFSWIDAEAANKAGVPICNIKNFSTQSVAEWATMMMFTVARRVPELAKAGFPLDFDKDFMTYRGVELVGKTAAIMGLGNIGSAIAERCAGLGMNVIYWSANSSNNAYESVELDELFTRADVLFPCLALNDDTKQLCTSERMSSLKNSAIIVTIAHELFDEDKAVKMVENGELFGLALEGEPESFSNYKGNVWAAPAYAWATDQSMLNSLSLWIDNMIDASKNQYPNRVN